MIHKFQVVVDDRYDNVDEADEFDTRDAAEASIKERCDEMVDLLGDLTFSIREVWRP